MERLKLFENFNSGEYYQQISKMDDRLSRPYCNITESEIDDISNYLMKSNLGNKGIRLLHSDAKYRVHFKCYGDTKKEIKITKFEDDWFLFFLIGLDWNNSIFICDQLDGLMKLINSF